MKTDRFGMLQEAFEQASRLNGRDRSDFVDELGQDDRSMAEELRTLLDHHERETDPLEDACEAHRHAVAAQQLESEAPPPELAGYRVSHRIGSGGQAEVYLAHQESTGQPVAVKVFRGAILSESQRQRIDGETQALVRLQLPNVVPILDRGVTSAGREYLVTRFVDGDPIDKAASRMLDDGPQRILELFARVAETLDRVHRHGIIHRDLKPSNILVDRDGEPYLLDFGLARFFADPSGRLLTITAAEPFQGSIRWACPEQVDASYGTVDQRSDIYSLGVALYKALTGRFPYPAEGGILAIAEQIVRARPQTLRDASGTGQPGLTPEIENIVLRALAKRPEKRFQSAGEFAEALRKACASPPTDGTVSVRKGTLRLAWPVLCAAGILAAAVLSFMSDADQAPDAIDDSRSIVATRDSDAGPIGDDADLITGELIDRPAAPSLELDAELLPFGEVPPGWSQVGALETYHHEIERAGLTIAGDYTIRLTLSADRTDRAGFRLELVGDDSGSDLRITGTKTNTWSDNETWEWQTPAGTIHTSLPIGPHTFTLQRSGELYTLSANAVARPEQTSPVLATFATGDVKGFESIRIATNGPALRLDRLRLFPGSDATESSNSE